MVYLTFCPSTIFHHDWVWLKPSYLPRTRLWYCLILVMKFLNKTASQNVTLFFNTDKTQLLNFHGSNIWKTSHNSILLGGQLVSFSAKAKFLYVLLGKNLKFTIVYNRFKWWEGEILHLKVLCVISSSKLYVLLNI